MTQKKSVTVGIVGCGKIGSALKRWLECYNKKCRVKISDPALGFNDDLSDCDCIFISIHIPTELDGSQKLTTLNKIVKRMPDVPIFIRTTVLPGTCDTLSKRYKKDVRFMPEYLTERTAFEDFCRQPMVFTGHVDLLKKVFPGKSFIETTSTEAELAKYAHNVFGALKVTYFNAIKQIADELGCDYSRVLQGVLQSGYVNAMHTSVPGPDGQFGYGGKCFPKDIEAFRASVSSPDFQQLLSTVIKMNEAFRAKKTD
ncbi:MAG: hypothetical protein IJH67_05275 [Thermoguttaceae bacterium]|nr:hypothetical protein [Thermoguttaceae bacterium]